MYMHVSPHKGVKLATVNYIFEDPPHILDGTISLGPAINVYETLRGLAEANDTLYLCISALSRCLRAWISMIRMQYS